MSFQTPITIAEAIRNIETNRYLLPAIQREFVWEHEKIEWLFDSIMRNYPISSFLFWRVEGETKDSYKFYQFIREFRQRYKTHNEEFCTTGHNDFTAVLDGQQRLTSLYIGLRGSYAYRRPRVHEENSERVYPTRHLYLNITRPLENEEDGRIYEFRFLTPDEVNAQEALWFRVSEIYGLADDFEFNKYLDANHLKDSEFSYRTLSTLKNVIHSKAIINYFLETEPKIDKALNIFIRINSGGEPLQFSDLLMSIAVANWEQKDARKEIHALVDTIISKGFVIKKDFVLRVFLYLHSKDIRFMVTNFSRQNAVAFEQHWDDIRDAILCAFDLVRAYGFADQTLTSKNAVMPIIYYLYHRRVWKGFLTKTEFKDDRDCIRKWLHVALVRQLFSSRTDQILSQIRNAFTADVTTGGIASDMTAFPVEAISGEIRKDVRVTDEFLDDLLTTQKDDKYAFSVLALLYPSLDYKNNDFHKDHLHPVAEYDRGNADWETYNSILNLQMLDANENASKNDRSLNKWVGQQTEQLDRKSFLASHLIPDVDMDIRKCNEFFIARAPLLKERLKTLLQ